MEKCSFARELQENSANTDCSTSLLVVLLANIFQLQGNFKKMPERKQISLEKNKQKDRNVMKLGKQLVTNIVRNKKEIRE